MRCKREQLFFLRLVITMLLACAFVPNAVQAQMTSTGIDCSQIASLHLLQQENMRAGLALMECGVIPRPAAAHVGGGDDNPVPLPPNMLVSNRLCNNAQSCTKSENMVWHDSPFGPNATTIVVNYNDHNTIVGQNYSGTSVSTNNALTFMQLSPPPFATGHGTNFGDPIVVYNENQKKLLKDPWFAGDLVTGCGGQGIGLWTSNSPATTWNLGVCAHMGSADDRESMWVDNEPTSPFYGRMYISWNDFTVGGGALFVTWSDDGVKWNPVQLSTNFIRDVQLTGTPKGPPSSTGTVFVAAMDEGGGSLNSRQNVMFRSFDGGLHWVSGTMGPRFLPPGDGVCASNSYFAKMNPIWRHMGWGQPAAGPNGVIHYAYAGKGVAPGDNGDIYYVRSTDNGNTWSSPILLNDDPGGQFKTQWMPSLSVHSGASVSPGKVTVSWYDRRLATTACNVVTDPGCNYQRYGIQSPDNGLTWGANFAISDIIPIPEPDQQDPGIQSCYAGDYDYSTGDDTNAFVTWTDGRRVVGGVQVQDVEFDPVP